jgi:hypothetical protein
MRRWSTCRRPAVGDLPFVQYLIQFFLRQPASGGFVQEGLEPLLEKIFSLPLTVGLAVFDNDQSDTAPGNDDSFILEQPIGTDDSVRIDGELPGKIADGRNHFICADRSGSNRKFDLHGNLFEYRLRQTGINFYEHDFSLS